VGLVGVGVYSLTFGNQTLTTLGAVFTLLNAFFWALYTIYYRKLKNQNATKTVATQFLFGALLFLPIVPVGYRLQITTRFWLDLAYLSLVSARISFWLWNAMSRLQRVGKTTTLIYLIPVAVTLVQYFETGLSPSPVELIGMGLMIFGIYIARFENATTAVQSL